MKLSEYPKTTIILRGVSFEEADAIVASLVDYKEHFSVEVTLNTENAFEIIRKLKEKFSGKVFIGAGTVRNYQDVEKAIEVGSDFLLGPHVFTKEMIDLAKEKKVLVVPSAMTPSEVDQMFEYGADIVKIFPAAVVGPRFFKDIQAPLGELPLMAVGGVSKENANEFFANQASYVGIGSSMFPTEVLESLDYDSLVKVLKEYIEHIY